MIQELQTTLFDEAQRGTARRTDPETSKEAAKKVNVADLEGKVLDVLRRCGGLTTFELSERLGIQHVSVSPRMCPLKRKGFVVDSGERRARAGRPSIVWKLVEEQSW